MTSKNIYIPLIVVLVSIILVEFFNTTKTKHPNAGLTTERLVLNYGYPVETHNVTTDDGYMLTVHRIPYGRQKTQSDRVPVLFMHGLTQSGADYVNPGPDKALSLILADKGYDIWLGNARGTTTSRKHTSLDPDKHSQFWNFSLHEIGVYDVPALIDYILKITKKESLHYVGYSQGTTIFFIMGSEKPEYIRKVRLMTALAPAIFVKNPKSPILIFLVFFRKFVQNFFYYTNYNEFLPNNGPISLYLKHICNENSLLMELCLQSTFLLHGYNHEGVNKSNLVVQFSNTPAGTSSQQLLHIIQLMESGEFHRCDFGATANLEKYGQEVPLRYNPSKITTPIALYYSINDWTINVENIDRVVKTFPNVVKTYKVPCEKFNHNDFLYGKNVVDLLYSTVVEEISKY